nr:NACHT domain-containing protein [Pseudanabaena mucicola]
MAKRSLKASPSGIKKAKQQFALKGWTQEYLANEVGIKTRQPIWRFFAGQAIERYTFFELCTRLDLDWREIALDPPLEYIDRTEDGNDDLNELGIDILVQTVRSKRREKINHQCGILRLLDVNRPIKIEQIYIDVNILEQIASQQWLEIAAINSLTPEDIDRYGLGKIVESQISGIQAVAKYNKLRVLGKPGSGKSTFLKHLAIECNREQFGESQIPIFIKLRDFAKARRDNNQIDLLEFIHQEFLTSDISQLSVIKKLLQAGRILLLIDGMDEVPHEEKQVVINEIRQFADKYHKNQFVATCRIASQKLSLQSFTDVEIAPFT